MLFHRHGGMYFWRVGSFGGSFYHTRKPAKQRAMEVRIANEKRANVRRELRDLRRGWYFGRQAYH